jgi:hypothetical protein
MKHYYDELCSQLRRADIDGDVITLPHNGEKFVINTENKRLNTLLTEVATLVAKIYINTKVDTHTLNTLVEDLKEYI